MHHAIFQHRHNPGIKDLLEAANSQNRSPAKKLNVNTRNVRRMSGGQGQANRQSMEEGSNVVSPTNGNRVSSSRSSTANKIEGEGSKVKSTIP